MRDTGTPFARHKVMVTKEKRMRLAILVFAALGLAAGCDKGPDNSKAANSNAAAGANTPPQQPQASTPTTPANIGQPSSHAEKKEGANPVQGQVDPKQPEQHRDFQQRGDGKGPTGPDTQPKRGG
jgi:hypothetical protein